MLCAIAWAVTCWVPVFAALVHNTYKGKLFKYTFSQLLGEWTLLCIGAAPLVCVIAYQG